ncbi:MAG: DinB family protein [Bacteroidota bacterium]
MSLPTAGTPATFYAHKILVEDWAGSLSAAQFNWKPSAKSWSVAECLVHLNRLAEMYAPALETKLATTSLPAGSPPFTYGWFARFTVRSFGAGSTRKLTSPADFLPEATGTDDASNLDPATVVGAFGALQDRLAAALDGAKGLDLSAAKMPSPAIKVLRLPLAAWFDMLAGHQARHLQQAQRVMASPGFPGT